MAKHWRKPTVTKNGVRRKGTWVKGSNPAPGCQMWTLGMIGLGALVVSGARRARRGQ